MFAKCNFLKIGSDMAGDRLLGKKGSELFQGPFFMQPFLLHFLLRIKEIILLYRQ